MNFVPIQITNTQHQILLQNKNQGIIDFCKPKINLLINFVSVRNENTQQKNQMNKNQVKIDFCVSNTKFNL